MRGVLVFLLLVVAASGAWAQTAIDFGRYHALVIGNNNYRHLPKLRTAVNDARAIADVLKGQYDFKVELLLNADRDAMVQAINRYRGLGDRDNLVIYYAGHGVLDEASERGFWLPVDAERDNEARWIDVATISGNLRAMNARHILVVADSCYSGTLTRSAPASLAQNGDRAAWIARMRERRARVALVSGGLEPVIDGGGGGHSVFARAVIDTLRENDGVLQGSELFNRLRGRVVANADQTPAYNDIRYAGHEGGDFIFVPRGGRLPPVAATPVPTPAAPSPAAPPPSVSVDPAELAFWDAIKNSTNPADYRAYLETYPQGRFAALARVRAAAGAPQAPAPKAAAAPPTPAAPPKQVAMAPPSAAAGALADAAAFEREWPKLRERLRTQYDRSWRIYENASSFEGAIDKTLRHLDGETVEIEFTYRVEPSMPGSRREDRTAIVRFRNRAPDFEVLDWKRK